MPVLRTLTGTAVAGCAALVAGLLLAPTAQAVDTSSSVVINEVYGGGGNAGAPYTNDFIELVNTGTQPVDLSTWSVQYGSAVGTTYGGKTDLVGSIAPGARYVVAESAGNTASAPLPQTDVTGTISMSGTSGKVALVSSTTTLTCGTACSSAPGVVDFVGYGGANDAAGGQPTGTLSNTTSAQRKNSPVVNTGVNGADFVVAAPTPGAATVTVPTPPDCGATPTPAECVPGTVTVQDVQGSGFLSPLRGQTVDKVPGIVTGVRSTGSSRGFWIQQAQPDANRPAASSGVFVFTSSGGVAVGDSVLVTGTVSDYYPLSGGDSLATTSNLSTTELTPTTVTVVSKGNTLPTPLTLTPTTVPDTYAPQPSSGNVEEISTVDPERSALEFWEAHEGMLVRVDDAPVVGPGKTQYGEIYVTTKPGEQRTYRGGTYLDGYDLPSGRLLVMPVNGTVPPANVGDVLVGTTSGPVDWSAFGGYDIAATTLGTWKDNGLKANAATPQAADQLSVATYNLENLAPGDAASKYQRLGSGLVTNLASPDVVSLEEIQDNTGAVDDGTVAADQTLTKLVAAIAAAGGPTYRWTQIDPTDGQDGGQPGGNIRVAFLYNPDRVTFVERPGGDATTAVGVQADADGTPALTVSPGRIDPTNAAWQDSRKPLAGEFVFQGRKVIVVANHFNSKGGDQSADGRFQPPARTSEEQRVAQARAVNTFVKQVLAVDPRANVVLAGDFNDYQFSPALTTLTDDGSTLTDLINTLPADQRYTYNFNGISQVLDHILVSKVLSAPGAVEYQVVHVNSDFSAQASDHDPQVARIRPAAHEFEGDGNVRLAPSTVKRGHPFAAVLTQFAPSTRLSVWLDGDRRIGSATTDRKGRGLALLAVPTGTSVGDHTVVVRAPDGSYAQARLRVR